MVTRRWTCLLPSERVAAAKRFWVAASSVIKWVGEFARRAAGRRVRSAVTSPTSCRGQSRLAAGARCHFTLRGLVAELAERGGKEIGRASWRERVCQYVSISVVAASLKKKRRETWRRKPRY